MKIIRSYSELISFPTFKERFEYLRLKGTVGRETFGFDRWMNQEFYQRSLIWKQTRDFVITRDLGCDLGVEGHEIPREIKVIVHHMNPVEPADIREQNGIILDPEYLITTIHRTHQAIHYGDERQLLDEPVVRRPNDTCPWRR